MSGNNLVEAGYRFTEPSTVVMFNGVPLSGKSTIGPLVAAQIEGCVLQNMDIFRILALEFEKYKPENLKNKCLPFGSCDAYHAVGDGTDSPANLIEGYMTYSRGVCTLLGVVLPQLEAQGAKDVMFEGVQLAPEIIAGYLKPQSRFILVKSDVPTLARNAETMYGSEQWLKDRYNPARLMYLQEELVRQLPILDKKQVCEVENTGSIGQAVKTVMDFLVGTGAITKI